jgi:hypothetical protein
LAYYSNGALSHDEIYTMPSSKRRYYLILLAKIKEEEKKQQEKSSGKIKKPNFPVKK